MSVAISISEQPDDIWMLQNRMFPWFASLVAERFENDSELVSEVRTAEVVNGVCLDKLKLTDADLAGRLASAFREIAAELANDQRAIPPEVSESTDRCRQHFKELVSIIDRFLV